MKKLLIVSTLLSILCITGCTSKMASMPTMIGPGVPVTSEATVDVLGPAVGTSSGGVLLGFIPIGCEAKSGVAGMFNPDPIARAAVYNAIDSVEGADCLIAPRYKKEVTSFIVYKRQTVEVKGKAIRYNTTVE